MSDIIEKLENKTELSQSNIGKYFLFFVINKPLETVFDFCSNFDEIGYYFDKKIKNNTKVLVLSVPMETIHPKVGKIFVTQIMSHDVMWVLTSNLVPIED